MTADTSKSAEFSRFENSLLSYFSAKGYRENAARPINLDNHNFNGGLRYDDTGIVDTPGRMIVQPCARLSDIREKHRRDILPLFHIFRCNLHVGQNREDLLSLVLQYLTGPLQLDPTRLAIVSIPPFEQLKSPILISGIEWERQVFFRDPDAAFKAGDGSGVFRHPGPDYIPAMPTAGLYFRSEPGDAAPPKVYPLPAAWTEIGEIMIAENGSAFFGLGVERLLLAVSGTIPTWEAQLSTLLARIRQDTGDGAMPPGAALFSES